MLGTLFGVLSWHALLGLLFLLAAMWHDRPRLSWKWLYGIPFVLVFWPYWMWHAIAQPSRIVQHTKLQYAPTTTSGRGSRRRR